MISARVEPIEGRRASRTNMFVMGTLYANTGSTPVKIRDLSPTGARIEGGVIPPVMTQVRLSRGALAIDGEIVWRDGARAGLNFSSLANVADWLPAGTAQGSQKRAASVVNHREPQSRESKDVEDDDTARHLLCGLIADALVLVKQVSGVLSRDVFAASRFGSDIQDLDAAVALLNKGQKHLQVPL